MDSKFFMKSKTIIGALLVFLPMILPALGVSINPDALTLFSGSMDQLIQGIGGVITAWGIRDAATEGGLSLTP